MDNLAGIRVFTHIVTQNSLSGAARELGMSNAGVSKHLNKLEQRLGTPLINRTTRRISLTEAGRAFYERCSAILSDLEEAERAVAQLSGAARGVLRVNLPMSFGRLHIAPLIPQFLEQYPDLTLNVTMGDSLVNVVDSGADVVVRIAELPDSSLVARKLASNRRIVCAAPSYLERHGAPTRLEDLAAHNCLRYAYHPTPHEWRLDGPDGEQRVLVTGTLEVNNSEAHVPALLAGVGLALLPVFIAAPYLRAGHLRAVLPDYDDTRNGIYAVHPFTRHPQPKVRAFVDFLANAFSPLPPWEEGQEVSSPSR